MVAFRINNMLFPDGKRKALTLSYDDGVVQDRRLVALMNQYGVRGTFNLNTGRIGQTGTIDMGNVTIDGSIVRLEEIAGLYENHEVSTHTANHTSLTDCGGTGLFEILKDREVLEGVVPYLVEGHAYPFGMYNDEVKDMLRAAGIRYARTVFENGKFELPKDFLEWHPTCHHNNPELMNLAKQFCEQDAMLGMPQIFYLWGHSYEFDLNDNWKIMEDFLGYIYLNKERIWLATNIEIVNYVEAFHKLRFSASGTEIYNPTDQKIWIEVNGKSYTIFPGEVIHI